MNKNVNKNDPEDCEACGDELCLYHEGWSDAQAAMSKLFAAVAEDPEAAWNAYMRRELIWGELPVIDRIVADHRDAQQLREEAEQERHYKRQANQQSASLAVEKIALEERVRVLEEALREMLDHLHNPFPDGTPRDGYTMKGHGIAYAAAVRHARTLLLSPAAATEGGEEA